MNELGDALLITVVGMGLVFVGILLTWLLMWALVRVTADPVEPENQEESPEADASADERSRKARAAAAAVAVAMEQHNRHRADQFQYMPDERNNQAWQTVMRMQQITRRGTR